MTGYSPLTIHGMNVTTHDPARMSEEDVQWSEWMRAAQRGDRAAYASLLRSCAPRIRRVARAVGVSGENLDDVVQETLMAVHRARHTFEAGRSFTAWLNAIARRRAIDSLRSRGRLATKEVHAPLAYEAHADDAHGPEEAREADQRDLRLRRAVAGLSPGQREAVEALAFREQSLDETAEITGKTKGALKVNLHRALKSLRDRLGREE